MIVILQVSFTGSTETGRKIMQAAALSNLKPVSLELGGKSPVLIFEDADIDKAVDLALFGILHNKVNFLPWKFLYHRKDIDLFCLKLYNFQGEICVAFSRVFVQEGIYDEFEKKIVEKAKTWVVGDPFDPKVQQGPQVRLLEIGTKQLSLHSI